MALSKTNADVAVVIVNYRTPDLTERCLAALQSERGCLPKLRAVVVDGGSADGSAEALAKSVAQPRYADWVSFVPLAINGGYGWANNQAILTLAREPHPPEFIHVLNPDAEVSGGAVAVLVEELRGRPNCGAVGSQLLAPDGREIPSSFRFPSVGREFVAGAQSEGLGRLLGIEPTVVSSGQSAEVDWVSGASVMFRSAALRDVGLFDDGFFLYFEEVELMHRMKAKGWSVRRVPQSRVVHIEGASTGGPAAQARPQTWYESRRRYFALTGSSVLTENLAWLAGHGVGLVKRLVRRSNPPAGAHATDLLRWGFGIGDTEPSVPAWGDAPGKTPAWMERR
jgi:hypothetical protein